MTKPRCNIAKALGPSAPSSSSVYLTGCKHCSGALGSDGGSATLLCLHLQTLVKPPATISLSHLGDLTLSKVQFLEMTQIDELPSLPTLGPSATASGLRTGIVGGKGKQGWGRADSSLAQLHPEPLLIPPRGCASAHRAGQQDAGEG